MLLSEGNFKMWQSLEPFDVFVWFSMIVDRRKCKFHYGKVWEMKEAWAHEIWNFVFHFITITDAPLS
jgi:hypothetical protein